MALFELDAGSQKPVYWQIVDEVHRSVAVGVLRPGEALPAAAVLAKELGVNINTVQHAYRTLVQEGMAHVKRGLGTFVSPTPTENRDRQKLAARHIAERMLREGFKHGLLASDLLAALQDIAPRSR